jgi:RNA polymerase sigma factor (sigma-70 family)
MVPNNDNFDQFSDEALAMECARRPVIQEAFSQLYQRYRPVVLRHILAKISPVSQAQSEDLAQEAFLRIFRALPRYDPMKSSLKTYIHTITDRVIIDFLRYGSLERAQTVSLEDHLLVLQFHAQQDPEVLLHVAERLAAKVEDPAKLPLVRDLLEGIEPKEVARRHEVKLNQVYAARTRLRELLEDISFELPLNP